MKLEDQVCTLGQAKRLEGLGISQSGVFSYVLVPYQDEIEYRIKYRAHFNNKRFSAFTVAELGVMLPEYHESHRGPIDKTWYAGKLEMYNMDKWFAIESTEARARAAFLIYLLENNLTTAEEVNKKLNQ